MQYFSEYAPYQIDVFDFATSGNEALYRWDQSQTAIPFSLDGGELYYCALIHFDDSSSGFYVKTHHCISDAWSLAQIGSEVMTYYHMLKSGTAIPEDPNPSYQGFIENEQQYLLSSRFQRDQDFWAAQFIKSPELTTLKLRMNKQVRLNAKRKSFLLPDKLVHKIKTHCTEHGTSIFAMFYAAMGIYLNRVKGSEDITIGTPVLNRTNAREKKTIGMFISTVPLRMTIDESLDFITLSRMVDQAWFSVLKHQKYPYEQLVRDVRNQNKGVEKLFDIAISYQNAKLSRVKDEQHLESRWHFNGHQVESFYLHINDRDDEGKLILNYDYLVDLFHEKEVAFIHDHVIRLLWHVLDNPNRQLSSVHMLSENEMKKVVHEFNQTEAGYPRTLTVTELFENQAANQPDRIALTLDGVHMTYRELNRRSNRLAHDLRSRGVSREKIVALLIPRSVEMIVAILAVIKAGGAYLPIDPAYPEERIHYMLSNSGTDLLLTTPDTSPIHAFDGIALTVDASTDYSLDAELDSNLGVINQPKDLLYVIYTSGSTGNPKGVMIEHQNLVRLIHNNRSCFHFTTEDVWTLFHSYCFDFSVWEMYGALLFGGRLVIVPRDTAQDTEQFLQLLQRENVTVLNQTPAAFYNLIRVEERKPEPLLSLRYVIFGGEALKPSLLRPFRNRYPNTELINMYGITETTVHVTSLMLSDEDLEKEISNIGRPIPTTRTYIVDRHLNPMPIGVPGELCVSGDGVGRGYLNNPQLTLERFMPNPFVPGERLYRSGDLARFFPRGDMEYLGRIDNQVKIRGHRIELGEIESRLLAYSGIQEAVVMTHETTMVTRQLLAYYVSSSPLCESSIRHFLAQTLPDYMIPAFLIHLDKLPLNANGKVDRDHLPGPDHLHETSREFQLPVTEDQQRVFRVWRDVLGLDTISIHDNFFHIGGDSLAAVMVVNLLGPDIVFSDLYQYPTIASLAETLSKRHPRIPDSHLLMKLSDCTHPEIAIICFPYGGGSGTIYSDLAHAVAKNSNRHLVYGVNLPGHDPGDAREFLTIEEASEKLVGEINSLVSGRIIFYGHCVGSALALETARKLEQRGIAVESIFLGGIMPPSSTLLQKNNYDPWKLVSDSNILRFLGKIGLPRINVSKELLKGMVLSFRHDVRSYYRFFNELEKANIEKLCTPVHCVVGEKDLVTRNYDKKFHRWNRYAQKVRLLVINDANHYFIKSHSIELAELLTHPEG